MIKNNICALIILFVLIFSNNNNVECKINKVIDKTTKPNIRSDLLNVHIVPHTHDDVGWIKTVDEYYYGLNMTINFSGVQYNLDNIIANLMLNPNRKFIYVEIAYFELWWNEQSEIMQNTVKGLVANGQFEFINGGYVMNDEATTYYDDIIDQMTLGHQFLWNTFKVMPKIGWHIDPFGHSSATGTLFGQLGFNGFIIGRMDYQDFANRLSTKQLEFMWRSSELNQPENEIFTTVLYNHYSTPTGFDWEKGCDPIIDNPQSPQYNIDIMAKQFQTAVLAYSSPYQTNNVLIPFGGDFEYLNAVMYFKNIDKLIKYINENQDTFGMNLLYSTPSIYIDAVNSVKNVKWNVKTDDMLPYANNQYSYWTGFFVSRPALKGYIRTCSALLHSVEQLLVTSKSKQLLPNIIIMRQSMAIVQHHDAITGTERMNVGFDYAKRLSIGSVASFNTINTIISNLLSSNSGNNTSPLLPPMEFTFCPLLNQSICPSTEQLLVSGTSIPIVIYNGLSWERTEVLRIPIPISTVSVSSTTGIIYSQVNEINSTYILEFYVTIPPLGYSTYIITEDQSSTKSQIIIPQEIDGTTEIILENNYIKATFSSIDGSIQSIQNKVTGSILNIQQEYLWYRSNTGDFKNSQCSGAYIFRPYGNDASPFDNNIFNESSNSNTSSIPTITYSTDGIISSWITRYWSDTLIQTFILDIDSEYLKIHETIGPIDIDDGIGKEVISRYSTDLNNYEQWYSDSNGREMQKRIKNYRESWNFTVEQPVSGNYVPVNSITYIQDESSSLQFTIVTDRSRGCTSLNNGQLDLMLHRRTLRDDFRGLGQPMNESTKIFTISNLIFHDFSNYSQKHYRPSALELSHPLLPMFSVTTLSPNDWFSSVNNNGLFTPLKSSLPNGLKIQSLQWQDDSSILLRIENIYQIDNQDYQDPTTIQLNLQTIFSNLSITSVTEMNLTGVIKLSNLNRLKWNTTDSTTSSNNDNNDYGGSNNEFIYHFKPMQIRTFILIIEI